VIEECSNITCVMFCPRASYVKNLIHEVNLPPFGKLEVGITINNRVIYASRPALNSVPIVKNVRRRQSASNTIGTVLLDYCRKLTSPILCSFAISFHCFLCSVACQRRILLQSSRYYYSAWTDTLYLYVTFVFV
jgi:hypothetical protein